MLEVARRRPPVTSINVEPDRQPDIDALNTTLTTVERVLDVDGLRSRITDLERDASDPNLWDDQTRAQKVTSELFIKAASAFNSGRITGQEFNVIDLHRRNHIALPDDLLKKIGE